MTNKLFYKLWNDALEQPDKDMYIGEYGYPDYFNEISADVSEVVSTVFLIGATLYNTWKNRNVSSASQTGQKIVDAIKSGELLVEEVDELLAKVHK